MDNNKMSGYDDLKYPLDADSLREVVELLFDPTLIAAEDIPVRDQIFSDLQKLPSTNIGPFSITFLNRVISSDPEHGTGSDWVSIDVDDEGMEFSAGNHCHTPGVGGDTYSETTFKCWSGGSTEGYLIDWLAQLKALDRNLMRISVNHEFQEAVVNDELEATLFANSSSDSVPPAVTFRSLTTEDRARLARFDGNTARDMQLDDEAIVFNTDLSLQVGQMMALYFEDGPVKFADAAFDLVADLNLSLFELKPYLRGWYEANRCSREDAGDPVDGMDSLEAVKGAVGMIRPAQS